MIYLDCIADVMMGRFIDEEEVNKQEISGPRVMKMKLAVQINKSESREGMKVFGDGTLP